MYSPYYSKQYMGNNQMQAQYSPQASKTTPQQAMKMFRDQIGTVMSVSERLLYSLGKISDPSKFKFHAFSPERLVERDPNQAAYKLLVVYKYLSSFNADMNAEFANEAYTIKKLHQELELAFATSAEELFALTEKLEPEYQLEKRLLQEVLHRIFKGDYRQVDPTLAADLKSEIKRRSGPETRSSHDHSSMMGFMHKANTNLDDTVEYMNRNPHKQPNSAYEPATRVPSTQMQTDVNYIGGNSYQQQGSWNSPANTYGSTYSQHGLTQSTQQPAVSGALTFENPNPTGTSQYSSDAGVTGTPAANCHCAHHHDQRTGAVSAQHVSHHCGQVQTSQSGMDIEKQPSDAEVANEGAGGQAQPPHESFPKPPLLSTLTNPVNRFDTRA